MAKVMLIMDMPSSCLDCPCSKFNSNLENHWECEAIGMELSYIDLDIERPRSCPLREVPSKHEDGHTVKIATENDCFDGFEYERGYCDGKDAGYNACIDEILGGGE